MLYLFHHIVYNNKLVPLASMTLQGMKLSHLTLLSYLDRQTVSPSRQATEKLEGRGNYSLQNSHACSCPHREIHEDTAKYSIAIISH